MPEFKIFYIYSFDCFLLRRKKEAVKSEEFKHGVTESLSFTEKVKLEINTLCNFVSPNLCVENTFDSFFYFYHVCYFYKKTYTHLLFLKAAIILYCFT